MSSAILYLFFGFAVALMIHNWHEKSPFDTYDDVELLLVIFFWPLTLIYLTIAEIKRNIEDFIYYRNKE